MSTEYNPPNTFYSQVYGLFESEDMYKFIGKNGSHFKFLTTKLGLDYIWWNKKENIIELWGKHQKLANAKILMQEKLDLYMENNKPVRILQRCNAISIEEAIEIQKIVKEIV